MAETGLLEILAQAQALLAQAQAIIEAGNRPLVELAEVPKGYDDPESKYWMGLSLQTESKLCRINQKEFNEVSRKLYSEYPGVSYTWRQRAEAMLAKLSELTEAQGGR